MPIDPGGARGDGQHRRRPHDMPIGSAREWLASYVYGNITLLSAAIAVGPEQIRHGAAVGAVLATGVLTFLAHVLSHFVASGLERGVDEPARGSRGEAVRGVLRTARPIATSAVIPAVLYAAAWLGWLPTLWMQTAAIVVLAVRIGLVGVFLRRFSGEVLTVRALWSGAALATVAFGIGFMKLMLTH